MKIVTRKLSELRPLEKNVRKHNDKQIGEYIKSIDMFGQLRPMVIDEDGVILAGNGLYEALLRKGAETGDCYVAEGLTEKQKKKLMLADNRIYELGKTDMDSFDEIIRDLEGDLDVPGWDEDLLQTITSSIKEADALIESYGLFDPEEVSAVSNREREDHTAFVGAPAPDFALQRPSATMQQPEPLADRVETQTVADPTETQIARIIICPHCGQRFTLTPDMIGGE